MAEDSGKLKVSRGDNHKIMRMDIELLANGKLYFFMKDYIEESIDLFGEEISAKVSSPANKGVQNIDESSTIL